MKQKKDLERLLNFNFLKYTNKTVCHGIKDLPALYCDIDTYPDYLALYSQTNLYHKTDRTGVCFYQYDEDFDGRNGLYQAIYFNDAERLDYFRRRFQDVKFIIQPDYSLFGDIPFLENEHRLLRARIAAVWFTLETSAIVIPNISFPTKRSADFALDGLEECSVVAMSTKSHMQNSHNYEQLSWRVKYTADHLNLRAIIVYDGCGTDDRALECFSYAMDKGIEIVIPGNTLKTRNAILQKVDKSNGLWQ